MRLRHFFLLAASILPLRAEPQSTRERISVVNPEVRSYPEIDYVIEKDGKPNDFANASYDPDVRSEDRLVIWLMSPPPGLFGRLNSYGYHAIQVPYANGWFSKLYGNGKPPEDDLFLSKVRLEAATGRDVSPAIHLQPQDGLMARSVAWVRWLHRQQPKARWNRFLNKDKSDLLWEKVILSGASHGATTAARLAKEIRVDRVVMFCGPRDQFERWQSLPSATPPERYFGFSHVLDTGWSGDHYCRSWQLLGLAEFGPVTDIDATPPPFNHSRRLITAADVGGDIDRAHGAVVPGPSSPRNEKGEYLYEAVWRYLFTQPTGKVGPAGPPDPDCRLDFRSPR